MNNYILISLLPDENIYLNLIIKTQPSRFTFELNPFKFVKRSNVTNLKQIDTPGL